MDIRTWQDADRVDDLGPGEYAFLHEADTAFTTPDFIAIGPADPHRSRAAGRGYSARHRSNRSPFSPLRPAPIAIGSLSTAAIAALAIVAPALVHGRAAGSSSPLLDGLPGRIAPLVPGTTSSSDGAATAAPSSAASTAAAPAAASGSTTSSPKPPAAAGTTSAGSALAAPIATSPAGFVTRDPQPSSPSSDPTTPGGTPPASGPTTPPSPASPSGPTSSPSSPTAPTATSPSPTPSPSSPAGGQSFNSAAATSSALSEITVARQAQGNSALSTDTVLNTAANQHTADMVKHRNLSHIGSDGSDPYSRAGRLGCWTLTQELIARANPGDDVVAALMQDPHARHALLSGWTSAIGISAQQDPNTGQVYWTIELSWM